MTDDFILSELVCVEKAIKHHEDVANMLTNYREVLYKELEK